MYVQVEVRNEGGVMRDNKRWRNRVKRADEEQKE